MIHPPHPQPTKNDHKPYQVLFPDKDATQLSEWYEEEKPKLSETSQDLLSKVNPNIYKYQETSLKPF